MGLLDWLISDTGSSGSTGVNGNPMMTDTSPQGDPTGLTPKVPQPPTSAPLPSNGPEMAPSSPDVVPIPQPRPAAANGPPVPMPVPRPPGANAGDTTLPPAATPTAGIGMPGPAPGMPQAEQQMPPPSGPVTAGNNMSLLSRAFGLDPNQAKQIRGSLASGLSAAASNSNKPGLAAFAAGMGGGLKGGSDAESKIEDKQHQALQDAIKAAQEGNAAGLNKARTQLALAQAEEAKASAASGGRGSKSSVLNTQEQLYLRGLGAVNNDPQVKASAAQLRALASQGLGPDSPQYKAAQDAHNKLIEQTKKTVFGTLGITEKAAGDIASKPGFSERNPVPKEGLTQQKFDQLPPGAYFINPANNQLMIKQPPQASSPTPSAAPSPVTAPAGGLTDQTGDE